MEAQSNAKETHLTSIPVHEPIVPDNYEPAQSLAGIEPTQVQWIWWPWIPLHKISILEGEPDVGKSNITLDIAARVSLGRPFPQTTIKGENDSRTVELCNLIHRPSGVLIVGTEDDIADTMIPRLKANGANLNNIYKTGVARDSNGIPIPLLIPEGIERLKHDIKTSKAKLVIIDPITAILSDKVKPGDDASNRKALNYLAEIAVEYQCAILLIRHLNKNQGQSAKNRGSGTVAIGAVARSVFAAYQYKDEDTSEDKWAISNVKCNIAPKKDSLAYHIEPLPNDPNSVRVVWGKPIGKEADELIYAENSKQQQSAIKTNTKSAQARKLIMEYLANGPQPTAEVTKQIADEIKATSRTIQRAAEKINVKNVAVRNESGAIEYWLWELDDDEASAAAG